MKYNELKIKSYKRPKRVGRGIAAGQGKTAGRGTKGQNARAGGGVRPGFEGGQNPLMQRFPKLRGFTSHRRPTETVYTGELNNLKTSSVDSYALAKAGLISSPYVKVKLVLSGKIDKKLDIKLQSISSGAQAAVKKAGGSFSTVPQPLRPVTKEKTSK